MSIGSLQTGRLLACFPPARREVVRWLKGWDPCVFGTAAPAQRAQQARGVGSRFQQPDHKQQQQQQRGGAPDPLGRPEHKVILIAGPPGGHASSAGWPRHFAHPALVPNDAALL